MSPADRIERGAAPWLARRVFALAMGLLVTALLCDLIDLATGTGALALPAYWLSAAGIVCGLAAALCRRWATVPPAAGWSLWPLTRGPGFFKSVAIALFAAGWSLRSLEGDVPRAALVMAVLGVGFAIAAPWLPGDSTATAESADPGLADTSPHRRFEDSRRNAGAPPAGAL